MNKKTNVIIAIALFAGGIYLLAKFLKDVKLKNDLDDLDDYESWEEDLDEIFDPDI